MTDTRATRGRSPRERPAACVALAPSSSLPAPAAAEATAAVAPCLA